MTALEDLELREKEIKTKLDLAESLEERKQLRSELRELRRKIFDTPASTTRKTTTVTEEPLPKTTSTTVSVSIVKNQNTKNFELSNLSKNTPAKRIQPSTTKATTKFGMSSVARRSRLFENNDDNNNNTPDPKPSNTPRLKVQSQGNDAPSLRTRDPADRAARRARRAQQQKEMSVDQGKPTDTDAPKTETVPTKKEENRRSISSLSLKDDKNDAPKESSTIGISKPSRPTSSYGSSSRFSSIGSKNVEPPPPAQPPKSDTPSFGAGKGDSAADRMAFFRQAAAKEKEQEEKKKAIQEARQKQSEMISAVINGEMEMGNTKAETKEKKEEKKEMKDSEKMRNATAPCMKKREKKKITRRTMSIGSIVLDWVQEMIKDYPVEVTNFSSSWNDGMAFCALIHRFNPDEFDFSTLKKEDKRRNFDLAFQTGMKVKNIPMLLDTDDMVAMTRPEPRSVQTYIQWIWSVYGPTSGYGPTPKEVQK